MKFTCEACGNGPCKCETRLYKPVVCLEGTEAKPKWEVNNEPKQSGVFDEKNWD
jgi:hypothetical protein